MIRRTAILFAALFPALAFADVPPPPGYVETCTAERQCKKGEEADVCSAYYGDRDACIKKHDGDGYQHRCRTGGASVWSEVWCRPPGAKKTATTPAVVTPTPVPAPSPEPKPAAEVKLAPDAKPAPDAKAQSKRAFSKPKKKPAATAKPAK